MKNAKRFLALVLLLCSLLTLTPTTLATTGTVSTNNATRHIVCTALPEQAQAYYNGDYTYDALSQLDGVYAPTDSYAATQNNPLYTALSALMTFTHTNEKVVYGGYGANALATYWQKTDAEQGAQTYLYFYTDILSDAPEVRGLQLNREHVWPKSRASFFEKGGGADLHHLRPSISSVNLAKSNYAFGTLVGTDIDYSTTQINGVDVIWTKKSADLLEVRDNIKGDVARIMLYVYVRWQQPNLYSSVAQAFLPPMDADDSQSDGKRVFESLETLLKWCELDPVDEWEMQRNNQVENVQGNRNVFIDYPEFAWLLFDREIPSDMVTPSGEANPTLTFDITWNVDGVETTQACAAGEMPTFTGNTEKADDAAYRYEFIGWEPALAPAREDMTYTAKYDKTPLATPPSMDFTDVTQGAWYYDAVQYAVQSELMNGVGSNCFAPNSTVTRAMLVTILYRVEGEPDVTDLSNPFADVPAGKWYTDAVIWAAEQGIVNGISETAFAPERPITREQIAAILYRYDGTAIGGGNISDFPDAESVSSYAVTAMRWAVSEGLISGMEGRLAPRDEATRAQLAVILKRYLEA